MTESDLEVMEEISEDRNQRKDSAQRALQTECAVCAKALRRKPTWQGSDTQGVQEGRGRLSRADGVGKEKEP